MTLWVNGAVVNRWPDCEVPKGYVGLEAEGYRIEFRNVKVKSLEDQCPRAEISSRTVARCDSSRRRDARDHAEPASARLRRDGCAQPDS